MSDASECTACRAAAACAYGGGLHMSMSNKRCSVAAANCCRAACLHRCPARARAHHQTEGVSLNMRTANLTSNLHITPPVLQLTFAHVQALAQRSVLHDQDHLAALQHLNVLLDVCELRLVRLLARLLGRRVQRERHLLVRRVDARPLGLHVAYQLPRAPPRSAAPRCSSRPACSTCAFSQVRNLARYKMRFNIP